MRYKVILFGLLIFLLWSFYDANALARVDESAGNNSVVNASTEKKKTISTSSLKLYGNAEKELEEIGITKTFKGQKKVMDRLTAFVYMLIGFGGIWAVAWMIIGGILLAGSAGSPMKRNAGLAAVLSACLGLFVIYKAYDIANWMITV